MVKNILKTCILILAIIGIFFGVKLSINKTTPQLSQKEVDKKIFGTFQIRSAEITQIYTYGKALGLKGNLTGISKDNFESIRLVISDGKEYEKQYKMYTEFKDDVLEFSSQEINSGIVIDDLDNGEYYIYIRIKQNNNVEPKYYSLKNISEYPDIEYFTLTKDEKNRKAQIKFSTKNYNEQEYSYLSISLEDAELPDDVYDIVIDAGHGGKDTGEKLGSDTEANITLEYAKILKERLEEKNLKVTLTRDDSNTDRYNYTNMYDSAGRITSACKSKSKLMISFHINNGNSNLSGLEIYSPCKSNLEFAKKLAENITSNSNLNYSNNNTYKVSDGVFVKNFTAKVIKEYNETANKKGYEPYNITTDTPYLYTIREVGGIATNAYVDGRNKEYSKNEFYNSNQGIECYQIELGYIKNNLDSIKNEKEQIVSAITDAIINNY